MRAWYDSENPSTLEHCCGVPEIGGFVYNDDKLYYATDGDCPKVKDFEPYGCGIFVSTFLPSQEKAMKECEKYHTLLFKTGPHLNTGPDASTEGKEEGVYLCVFKFGKG
jgi:hypothetical protein